VSKNLNLKDASEPGPPGVRPFARGVSSESDRIRVVHHVFPSLIVFWPYAASDLVACSDLQVAAT
jgi:hypothetical protein